MAIIVSVVVENFAPSRRIYNIKLFYLLDMGRVDKVEMEVGKKW